MIPVLLVAHQSPPLGGPGVGRVEGFLRHGPECGIDPVLVTAPPEDGARAHGYPVVPGSDASLAGRTVVRVPTPLPGGPVRLLRALHAPPRVAWTLFHGRVREPESAWARPAVAAGIDAGRRAGVRAVVSTSQPYVDHRVGLAIARALGVPWVADFRDPMTEAPGRSWPTRLHWWRERREERRIFERADLVWANTEAAAARWRERFPFAAGNAKIRVRRNGVAASDRSAWLPPRPPPPLRIGHLGRFTEREPSSRLRFLEFRTDPGGPSHGSPEPLFAGLARFLSDVPAARGAIVWVTVGDDGPAPPPGVAPEPHGVRPTAEALRVMAGCHALFLPLTRHHPVGALFVPQKVYEYAALGRPVLASGTPREATDLLGPLALVSAWDDPAAMARHLCALWEGAAAAPSRPVPAPLRSEVVALCAADLRDLCEARAPRGAPR